jgi:hypothetical protein
LPIKKTKKKNIDSILSNKIRKRKIEGGCFKKKKRDGEQKFSTLIKNIPTF